MHFFDSHAHLGDDSVYQNIDEILFRAKENGLKAIVNIATNAISLERGLSLAKKHPWIFNAAAITPHDAIHGDEHLFDRIKTEAETGNLIAIGETGLDYHYYAHTKDMQHVMFCRHMELALACDLPLIIHCRDAFEDFFTLIDRHYLSVPHHKPGILHCFTGTGQEAKELISRSWFLSFSGIVTYKKSEDLRAIAKMTPIDQLLIETDSPYLAPNSKRSKSNEPSFVVETATLIATIKEMPVEEFAKKTSANAERVFSKRTI